MLFVTDANWVHMACPFGVDQDGIKTLYNKHTYVVRYKYWSDFQVFAQIDKSMLWWLNMFLYFRVCRHL